MTDTASWHVLVEDDVTLDGDGAGVVLLGPVPPQRRWSLNTVTVQDHATGEAVVTIGTPDGPGVGLVDTDPGVVNLYGAGFDLLAGQAVVVRWAGGTPGALVRASMRATGSAA